MKNLIIFLFLIAVFLFLFNHYNPFGIKLFNEDSFYQKEVVVETKKPVKKKVSTAKDYFLQGERNLDNSNYKTAISNFSKAIELDPDYLEAYKERASAKDKVGDFEGSKEDYEKYMILLDEKNKEENDSLRAELKKLVAETRKKIFNKNFEDAINDSTDIIETYPKFSDGYIVRGDTFFSMQKYQNALDDYKKALSLGDKTFVLYLKLANTEYELKLYKESISDYIHTLNLNPNYEYAYYKLIGAYIFTDDFSNALKSLNNYTKFSSTKVIKTNDYSDWIESLNRFTENETIRDLKSGLKKLKFV